MIERKDLKPMQLDIFFGKICPYCYSGVRVTDEKEVYGMIYTPGRKMIVCKNYPHCNSYVGTHKEDGTALGRLAKEPLRIAKKKAHEAFDMLWENGYLKRQTAYQQLSEHLGISREFTHIGMFNSNTCEEVRRWAADKIIQFNKK